MSRWSARLAALPLAESLNVDSADSADSPSVGANGAFGTNGIEGKSPSEPEAEAMARAVRRALVGMAGYPCDPDEEGERAAIEAEGETEVPGARRLPPARAWQRAEARYAPPFRRPLDPAR